MDKIVTGIVSLAVMVIMVAGVTAPIISAVIEDGTGDSEGNASGMRYVYNPPMLKYVDMIDAYESGLFSDNGSIPFEELEYILSASSGISTPLVTVIIQWEGDDGPTYFSCGQYYATDGENVGQCIYLSDVDFENRTCVYNVIIDDWDNPSITETRTFTSLKAGADTYYEWGSFYTDSTEGMYYGNIELASLEGITTIGVATTGGSNDALATLDAYAVNETAVYPVGGTVSRAMSFSDHILSEVSYTYTSGGSSGAMDDIFIIAPIKAQYETEDSMVSGDNECIGRYVDGRAYMSVMYGDENASTVSLAGGENGLYTFDSGIPPVITSIVTDGEYTDYYWEYALPYLDGMPCVGGGVTISIPSGGYYVKLYMDDIDWNAQTCTLYSRTDVGFPNFHFDSVQVLMRESDIGRAVDPVGAMELYNSATVGFYRTGTDVRLNSLEDATVIGQQVKEDKINWLAWVINDEVMYPPSGSTLVYTPAYTDHILSGAEFTLTISDSAVDVMTLGIIAPVSFEYEVEGSGGSGGLSPVLISIISLIPLLMAVGIVIGTIGYLKAKNQ